MLEQCSIEERWSGVNEMIDRWLQERQELIVQYCALTGIHEYSSQSKSLAQRLLKFCQLLVDYLSSGHFWVYYQLIREAEAFEDGSADLAKSLFPTIEGTTEKAMKFNDIYADSHHDFAGLSINLSKLGETLATRFEYEDRLIDIMHKAHREQVACL